MMDFLGIPAALGFTAGQSATEQWELLRGLGDDTEEAAARRAALAAAGDPAGLPLRRLTGPLRTLRLADTDDVTYDCDTWEDLARARERDGS